MDYLTPMFKKIKYLDNSKKKFLNVGSLKTIDFRSFFDERLDRFIDQLIEKYPTDLENGLITVKEGNIPIDGYKLQISNRRANITVSSVTGCYYALVTLEELARVYQGMIPPLEILDYPDFKVRGFMLDISRSKVPNIETIEKYIDVLSRLRYNHMELYVEGFSFEYKSMPFVNKDGNFISVEEYQQIEKYCYEHFIDLVPNQNGFGHMTEWLKLDEFKHLSNVDGLFNIWGSNRVSSTLDPTNPESFELVKKMYGDMLPYSSSKYFNMNFDEPYELGFGKSKEVCDKTCREEVFVEFFNKLASVVKSYGKTPMLWGDVIIHKPDVINKIDQDAILIDWGYNENYPFLRNAQMLKKLKRPYLLAPGTSTWGVVTSKYYEMLWSIKNAAEAAYHNDGLGIILTDWGDFGHLQYPLYSLPGIVYAGLLSWNYQSVSHKHIKEYLDLLVKNHIIVDLVVDMAMYPECEEHYRGYSTKLFAPIVQAELCKTELDEIDVFKTKLKNQLLTDYEVQNYKSYFNSLKIKIDSINELNDEQSLLKDELSNSLLLLDTLVDVNVFLKNYFNGVENEQLSQLIENNFVKYLNSHYNLWISRNKQQGYSSSAGRIERLLYCLKNLKKEATNYE